MAQKTFLAADLGAGSGRVIAGRFNGSTLSLEVLNRFDNTPVEFHGHIHWNVPALLSGVREGIAAGIAADGAAIASVGVDTWGVDYGLLDKSGRLLGLPYAYRDARNTGAVDAFCARNGGRRTVYMRTGCQFIDFNTLFQLDVESREPDPLPPKADRLLMMPDLLNFWLSGVAANEATIASTSNAIDLATKTWAYDLLEAAGARRSLFRDPVRPATVLGPVQGFSASFPVVSVGSHDTASAVASVPAAPKTRWGYLATGTWALMGVMLPEPLANDDTFALNYTHEGGVAGDYRFLKNITGMWLLQELRRAWKREGRDLSYAEMERQAAETPAFARLIDPDEAAFAQPGDMPRKFADACRRTGQPEPQSVGEFARMAYEGMILRYREVWREIERLTGVRREVLHMVGGATRDALHCQLTADALGIPVVCGPVEGTALGNVLAQMVASGDLAGFEEGRALVAASVRPTVYEPKDTAPWDDAFERWRSLRAK
jgi:sugar (pentulose or hexulose) kinase